MLAGPRADHLFAEDATATASGVAQLLKLAVEHPSVGADAA